MSKRPTVTITCAACGKEFEKDKKNYDMGRKNGQKNFYHNRQECLRKSRSQFYIVPRGK